MARAETLLRATNAHASLARLYSRRSDELQARGRLGEAKIALGQVLAEATLSRNGNRLANAYGGLGMLALRTGDLPSAADWYERAAVLHDSLGDGEGGMISRQNRAEVLAASGDLRVGEDGAHRHPRGGGEVRLLRGRGDRAPAPRAAGDAPGRLGRGRAAARRRGGEGPRSRDAGCGREPGVRPRRARAGHRPPGRGRAALRRVRGEGRPGGPPGPPRGAGPTRRGGGTQGRAGARRAGDHRCEPRAGGVARVAGRRRAARVSRSPPPCWASTTRRRRPRGCSRRSRPGTARRRRSPWPSSAGHGCSPTASTRRSRCAKAARPTPP